MLSLTSLFTRYGDTDSIFVKLNGYTVQQAYDMGNYIAGISGLTLLSVDTITSFFPSPIRLKFEKVYCPSIMISKKHYCGMCYTKPDAKPLYYEFLLFQFVVFILKASKLFVEINACMYKRY